MRILFLSTSMGLGGADQQLLSAAQVLRARGHEILIVSLTPLGPMGLEARASGLRTESLEMARGIPDPRGLYRLAKLARAWKPEVVHSHMVHANLMARALRLMVPVPVLVSTIHNIYEGGAVWMAAYRLTNRLVDHMTIISEAAADRFIGERIVPRALLTVVPNGIDTERLRNVPPGSRESVRRSVGLGDGDFAWLAVGRFEDAKDYPNMLRAFAKVRARQPSAVLLLVGRGSLQAETEALTRELGLEGVVEVPRRAERCARGDERGGRLRDVVRVGRHADGAARGGGSRAADRSHEGRRQPRGRAAGRDRLPGAAARRRGAGRRDAAIDGAAAR